MGVLGKEKSPTGEDTVVSICLARNSSQLSSPLAGCRVIFEVTSVLRRMKLMFVFYEHHPYTWDKYGYSDVILGSENENKLQ